MGFKVLGQLAGMLRESGTYIPTELENVLGSGDWLKGGLGGEEKEKDVGGQELGSVGKREAGGIGEGEGESRLKRRVKRKRRR